MVEAVGDPTSPSVAPGDFVILNWRAVCGTCRACRRGRPWYCFATLQRHAEDDAHRRHRAHAPRSASARSPRRRSSPRARPPRSNPARTARGRGPARVRRDGRARRGDVHGRGRAAATGRGVRVRRRRRRGRSRAPGSRARATIIAVDLDPQKLEWAEEFGATHTVNSRDDRPGRGDPRAHRRQRRRRLHRGGRAPRGARAGVLRARPRRHASCRSACPTRR